jgi:hypothetical protein
MIRVALSEEPASFEKSVRGPGLRAIAEMVGEKPPRRAGKRFKKRANRREEIEPDEFPPYWTEALDDLMAAYNRICAYSCFRIHPITGARSVDHMAAKSRRWDTVYEWSNYRLACALLNARKKDFNDVLDPFTVVDGWFQLEFVGFQVEPAKDLKDPTRKQVNQTIDRLGLNNFIFRGARKRDAENYWSTQVSLPVLKEESPFVASELRRQGQLNAGDI